MMEYLSQIILLLIAAIIVLVVFRRLHIPTSLGYLLVGIVLGPHTPTPVISIPGLETLAEFGVVFLLFTIGLNFSLPQIHALRHQILGLGTGQVVFTTLIVSLVVGLLGFPLTVAFVFGAIFAQSSTTIIASLLAEQGEENTKHGRLGLAMSVFQDVTAVPFLVVIPVLGISVSADVLAGTLSFAMTKAILAFALVFFVGRWLLGPLFHIVSRRKSPEIFTLAVLLVALLSAWVTNSLGLSLAFGGFLAGMMLGETEFRHQIESTISPFRDVLLGLFFVGIGMLFNPASIPLIWPWVILCALLIVVSKTLIVTAMMYRVGSDIRTALRAGLLLSVGGEFGLALVAIALDAYVINVELGQIAITSVLLAMVIGAVLIRFNGHIASFLLRAPQKESCDSAELQETPDKQVVIAGYGRMGHTIAVLLDSFGVPFIAFDTDLKRVEQGRADGHSVWVGDIADAGLLSAVHIERAALLIIAVDSADTALATMSYIKRTCPQVPVIVRVRDLETSAQLLAAGAVHAYPETIESSLRLGITALQMLNISNDDIDEIVQSVRDGGYQPILNTEAPES